MLPVVAIVGRPNVGKSTLFNRLARKRRAITHDLPGVTRDRIQTEATLDGRRVLLIDTGGMEFDSDEGFDREVLAQARLAIEAAHVLALVVDGREGLNPLDEQVGALLRGSGKTVLLVVNKVDGPEMEDILSAEFHSLGFPLLAVSGEHGFNLNRMREELAGLLPEESDEPEITSAPEVKEEDKPLRLAMLGRPNAGKSSIVNALLGEERLIVSEVAGTTRDAVDVTFERKGRRYVFVDTAGVRKRSRVDDGVEKFSVQRALASAKKSDAAILVIDAAGGLGTQDKKLIAFLDSEKTPFLIAINKIDLLTPKDLASLKKDLSFELRICPHVPTLYLSALSGRGLGKILKTAEEMRRECLVRIGTGELNRAMRTVLDKHQAPLVKRRRAKFYYLTQSEDTPPTFVFFVNNPDKVKPSYVKYLENGLRKLFNLRTAPLKLYFRSSHAPKE
jgi:GTPase